MDSTSENGWPAPRSTERKGSVRRAREMLEVGKRPRIRVPQENTAVPPPNARIPQQNAWPLMQTNVVDLQGRPLVSGGGHHQRPSRDGSPSPSVYPASSVSKAITSPLQVHRPAPSPQRFDNQLDIHPALGKPVPDANDGPSRKSTALASRFVPLIPDSLKYPPDRVPLSTWNSEQRASDILDTYMDSDSDGAQELPGHGDVTVVRQASLGKLGKPSLRTISKSGVEASQLAGRNGETGTPLERTNGAHIKETAAGLPTRRSFDSFSSGESGIDPEKPPIVMGEDTGARHSYHNNMRTLEKEVAPLGQRAPTISEMRPGARRPPRLNLNAVREAEARGSLTSLPDLIKRAMRLATNLERGNPGSRTDLLSVRGGSRHPFGDPNRKSGSIKDILASFPNPAPTPGSRSSWPAFWRKSTFHQLGFQEQGRGASWEKEEKEEKDSTRRHRCCGMPMWAFITACVALLLMIAAAVLIPIFVVVVPRENKSNDSSMCGKSTPCSNGGVSISTGNLCSCVCVNGFTGSRCKTAGDASCITTELTQNSTSRNATMGSDLPRLFQDSQENFNIPLDPVTIMAFFSQNNVSCTTENALVAFRGLSSNDNERRALSLNFVDTDQLLSSNEEPEDPTSSYVPTATVPVRRDVATKNGIVFEGNHADQGSETEETLPISTSKPPPPPSASAISTQVLDFSRVAVLYILQKTGALDSAMLSADSIQTHLQNFNSNSTSGEFSVDLDPSGEKGNFNLDFGKFTITDADGHTVGGV